MPLPFALDHINLWLVDERDGCTLVDTGYGDAATRALWDAHCESTLNRRPIVEIIATHYHPDHLGNAAWLAERFGAPIAMTAAEYLTGHAVHGQTAGYAVTDTCALFHSHGVDGRARAGASRRAAIAIARAFRSFRRASGGCIPARRSASAATTGA